MQIRVDDEPYELSDIEDTAKDVLKHRTNKMLRFLAACVLELAAKLKRFSSV